jgi:hypothetical protein
MLKWVALVVVLGVVAFWAVRLLGGDDESEVAAAIERVATSDDPAVCTESATQAYLEQVSGLPGDAAVTACIQTAGEPALSPDAVEVSEVTIDGDDATALVAYEGSSLSGATVEVALVRVDGEWLVDQRVEFEGLDREALAAGLRETLAAPPTSLTAAGAECASERLLALSKAGLQSALLSADTSTYIKAIVVCDRDAYLDSVTADLVDQGYPEDLAACVRDELDGGSDDALVALLDDPVAYTRINLRCDRDGFLQAYRDLVVSEGASADAGDCVASKLAEMSDAEIAKASVAGAELEEIYAECGIAG